MLSTVLSARFNVNIENLSDSDNPATNFESGDVVVRTLEYSLPYVFIGHVDMVQPTTFFGLKAIRPTIKNIYSFDKSAFGTEAVSVVTGCTGSSVTPKCLQPLWFRRSHIRDVVVLSAALGSLLSRYAQFPTFDMMA